MTPRVVVWLACFREADIANKQHREQASMND
jgi:hypothetical protein